MADRAAGKRLADALRVAMAQSGIETYTALALAAKVSPTTIDNWVYGRTEPRAHHLAKVAQTLRPHTTAGALERAYLGLPPEEVPLHEQVRQLVKVLDAFVPVFAEAAAGMTAIADQALLEETRAQIRERMRRTLARLDETPSASSEADEPP